VNEVDGTTVTLILENLSVFNGYVASAGVYGAGIWATSTNGGIIKTVMRNCIIEGNLNEGTVGGGFYTNGPFELYNTTFDSNSAAGGGAIWAQPVPAGAPESIIDGCTFECNISNQENGGAAHIHHYHNLVIRNSSFLGNGYLSESSRGPAIFSYNPSYMDISNCLFQDNWTDYWGGAIDFYNSSGGVIRNSVFINNRSGVLNGNGAGGAIDILDLGLPSTPTLTITNSTFTGNVTAGYQSYGSSLAIRGADVSITNSIFWGNLDYPSYSPSSGLYFESGSAAISYSDVQGGIPGGFINSGGNINLDPGFTASDYHLPAGSPAIDSGSNDSAAGITDIDGDYRILDGGNGAVVDMGADEYSETFSAISILQPIATEVVASGSKYVIAWGAPAQAEKFKVMYSTDGGATWKIISSEVEGNALLWYVPTVKKNLKQCLVKVIGYNEKEVKVGVAKSPLFTIEVVKITYPNGAESLKGGDTVDISWYMNNTVSPVTSVIRYLTLDGGVTWTKVDTLGAPFTEPGSHTQTTTLPGVTRKKAKVKVKIVLKAESRATVGSDTSDGFFTIEP
jgi:hypothetical protein